MYTLLYTVSCAGANYSSYDTSVLLRKDLKMAFTNIIFEVGYNDEGVCFKEAVHLIERLSLLMLLKNTNCHSLCKIRLKTYFIYEFIRSYLG